MSLNFENVGKSVIYNRSIDNIEDYVKGTIVGCYIGENEEYYITSIESSGECIRVSDASLLEIISSGGSVTPQGIVDATAQMTSQQAEDTRTNIDAEQSKLLVTINGDGVGTADKSFSEIYEAYENGKIITAVFDINEFILTEIDSDYAVFCCNNASYDSNSMTSTRFSVDDTDTWTYTNCVFYKEPIKTTISSQTAQISAADNHVYDCGTLTSLEITSFPVSGSFTITWTSGSTATTLTVPQTLHMPDGFQVEANMRYEMNVSDSYALIAGWSTT